MVAPLVIAGGIAAGAALAGQGLSMYGASQANRRDKKMIREQRDWDREMYSARYRITMADMKSAGLNPIVAMGNVGGQPTAAGMEFRNEYEDANLGEVANSALAAAQTKAAIKNIKQDTQLKEYQMLQARQAAFMNSALAWRAKAEENNTNMLNKILETDVQKAKAQAKFYQSELGQKLTYLERIMQSMGFSARDIKGAKR